MYFYLNLKGENMEIVKQALADTIDFMKSKKISVVTFLLLSLITWICSELTRFFGEKNQTALMIGSLLISTIVGLINIIIYKIAYYKESMKDKMVVKQTLMKISIINIYFIFILLLIIAVSIVICLSLLFLINKVIPINIVAIQLLTTFIPFLLVISLFVMFYKLLYIEESIIIHGKMKIVDYFKESKSVRNKTGKSTLILFGSFILIAISSALSNSVFKNNIAFLVAQAIILMIFNTIYTIIVSSIFRKSILVDI
jgi:hypothetical protein